MNNLTALTDLPVVADDELRKVRINADVELSRLYPGWVSAVFYCGRYSHMQGRERWLMFYSVRMTEESKPKPVFIMMGKILMADGSAQWGSVGGVR